MAASLIILPLTWVSVDQYGKHKLKGGIAELDAAGYETDWKAWLEPSGRDVADNENIAKQFLFTEQARDWPANLKPASEMPGTLGGVYFENGALYDPRAYFVHKDPAISLEEAKKQLIALNQPDQVEYEELLGILEMPYYAAETSGITPSLASQYRLLETSKTVVYQSRLDFHAGRSERAWRAIHAIDNARQAIDKSWSTHILSGVYLHISLLRMLNPIVDEAIRTDQKSDADWLRLQASVQQINPKQRIQSTIRGEIAFGIYATKNLDALEEEYSQIHGAEQDWDILLEKVIPLGYTHYGVADFLKVLRAYDELIAKTADLNTPSLDDELAAINDRLFLPLNFVEMIKYISANQDTLLLKIALKRYQLKHSAWPADLNLLSPDFIDKKRIENLEKFDLSYALTNKKLPKFKVKDHKTEGSFLFLDLSPLPKTYSQ